MCLSVMPSIDLKQSLYYPLEPTEGVKVDYSCLKGVCGACLTDVNEGSVEQSDSILSDKNRHQIK